MNFVLVTPDIKQGLEQQMVKLQNDKDTMAETNLREKTHLSEKVVSLECLVKEKTSSVKQLEDAMREQADSYRQQVESLKARCDSQVSLTRYELAWTIFFCQL